MWSWIVSQLHLWNFFVSESGVTQSHIKGLSVWFIIYKWTESVLILTQKTISFCLFRSQTNHHCTDDYIWTKFRPRSHLDQKTSRWLRSRCRIQVVASIQTSIRSIQAKMLFLLKGSAPILSKSVRNPNPSARGWSWTRIQFDSKQIRILLSPRPSFMQQHWSSWSPFWRNEIGKGKLN